MDGNDAHAAGGGLREPREVPRALKLEGTALERAVEPVEESIGWQLTLPFGGVVAVLALHEQLPALAWAFSQAAPDARLGYVQVAGGALDGSQAEAVGALRGEGLLCSHITAGAAHGGEGEALTTAGALYHAMRVLGWDAAVVGPGPAAGVATAAGAAASGPGGADGYRGSGARGQPEHAGLAALDSAHTALALGCATLLVPMISSAEPAGGRRRIAQDTLAVLDLLLAPVAVALPAGLRSPVGADLRAGLGAVFGPPRHAPAQLELDVARPARIARHDWRRAPIDLPAFAAAAAAAGVSGAGPVADPLFHGVALAAGATLAELVEERLGERAAGVLEHHEEGEGAAA